MLSEKTAHLGERVVIIGGNATGCETAHYVGCLGIPDPETFTFLMVHSAEDPIQAMGLLHKPWRKITVIEMTGKIAGNVSRSARWSLMKSLKSLGVELRTGTRLLEVTDKAVVVMTDRGEESIPADTVVLATGVSPVKELEKALEGTGVNLILLGDADKPGKIEDAVRQGFEAALRV